MSSARLNGWFDASRPVNSGVRRLCDMNRYLKNIILTLDSIESVESEAEVKKLHSAVDELFASDQPERGMEALLRIFERFPDKDGYGVFWSILHGLETLPGYEVSVVESVRRQPSEFGLLMINRMLNVGRTRAGGVDLMAILEEVSTDPKYSKGARQGAREYLEWQRTRA
jgi:hypothetical protein